MSHSAGALRLVCFCQSKKRFACSTCGTARGRPAAKAAPPEVHKGLQGFARCSMLVGLCKGEVRFAGRICEAATGGPAATATPARAQGVHLP